MTDPEEKARAVVASTLRDVIRNGFPPLEVDLIRYKAKLCKQRYDALREAKFDRIDALFLCTKSCDI